MFRKITIIALPALMLAALVADNSASSAFARGGNGGRGRGMSTARFNHSHRSFHNHYNWGSYRNRGYFGYETPVYTSAYESEPVDDTQYETPVVSTVSEPVYNTDYGYNTYFGRGYNRHYRNHGHFFSHNNHRGGGRRR